MQQIATPTPKELAAKMATWSQERYHQERTFVQMADLPPAQAGQVLELMSAAWKILELERSQTALAPKVHTPYYGAFAQAPAPSVIPTPGDVNKVLVPFAKIAGAGGVVYLVGSGLVAAAPIVQAALAGFFAAVMAPVVAIAFVGFIGILLVNLLRTGHGTWQPTDGPTPGGGGGKKKRVVMEQTQRTYIEED